MVIGDILAHHATNKPAGEALVFGARRLTWRQLDDGANRLANALVSLGVQRGDRVLLLLNNCVEFVESYYGLAKIGVISAPIVPTLVGAEVAYIANALRARFIIVEAGAADIVRSILANTPSVEAVIGVGQDHGCTYDFAELVKEASSARPAIEVSPDEVLTVKFTSGTTGLPKGCLRTHYGFNMGALSFLTELPLEDDDIGLISQTMAAGMAVYFLTIYIFKGVKTIMLPRFDPASYLDAIEREAVTHTTAMDWMARRLVADPSFPQRDLSSLRLLHGINVMASLEGFLAQGTFRADVSAGYASSEAGGMVTYKTPEDFRRALSQPPGEGTATCGRQGRITRVECLDDQLQPVATGEVGELAIRGPTLFRGYWERPEETAQALRDGWMLTGDLAYKDEQGYLFLCGRKRDVIRSAGMNIYPAEVEPVLVAHPKISEAALIARPDVERGEVAVACVLVREACTPDEINAWCRERLASHKRPREIIILDSMPMTASGKVLKRELISMLFPKAAQSESAA